MNIFEYVLFKEIVEAGNLSVVDRNLRIPLGMASKLKGPKGVITIDLTGRQYCASHSQAFIEGLDTIDFTPHLIP